MEYITREDLDKRLELYEKIGAAEKQVGKLDTILRAFQKGLIDDLELKISQVIDQKISTLDKKIQADLKQIEISLQTNLMAVVDDTLKNSKDHISTAIKSEVFTIVNDVKKENGGRINSEILALKNDILGRFEELKETIYKEVQSKNDLMSAQVANDMYNKSNTSISNAANLFSKSSNALIENYFNQVVGQLHSFKIILLEEIDKKLVDKVAIDSKFTDLEVEMKRKVQKIIEYQLNNARNMMEQSARAEINDSLKSLSGNLLGSI